MKVTAPLWLVVIWIAWFAWCVYLMIKIAGHVGAWPFG